MTATRRRGSIPCSQQDRHTPCPRGYVAWFDWADEMAKTHRQTRCPGCGLWKVWETK